MDHGIGIERLTVVELDSRAQLHLPGPGVYQLGLGGRKPGDEFAVRRAFHERLVHVIVDRPLAAVLADLRVEGCRLRTQRNDNLLRSGRGRDEDEPDHDEYNTS